MTDGAPRIAPRPILRRIPDAVHGGPSGDDASRAPIRADFSTSVNAYGPAPSVVAAVREALDLGQIASYPDPACRAARRALADHFSIDSQHLLIGAGATELILAVTQSLVRPGDRILVPPHAFGEYTRIAMLCGASVILPTLPRAPSPLPGIPALVSAFERAISTKAPRIVFLCTPESPSGRAWPIDAVRAIADACERTGTLLVLDQSFDAFTGAPLGTPALRDHPAVLHLRSLTKDHALAGLRLGALVGPPALIAAVERARIPWSVSAPAQAAAVAACAVAATTHMQRTTALLRQAAVELGDAVRQLGIATVPSDAHYFLIDVGDARAVSLALRERHAIVARDCASFGLPAHLRIAARPPGDNRLLLTALGALRPASHLSPSTPDRISSHA